MKFRTRNKSLPLDNKSDSSPKKGLTPLRPKRKTASIIGSGDKNEGRTKPIKTAGIKKSQGAPHNKTEIGKDLNPKYTWGYDNYEVEDSGFERYGRPPNKSLQRNITREGSGLFESDIDWKNIEPNEND